jgi:transposase
LIGELRQIAPLLGPWAQAIAAHGRQAGQVHCGETSWQVFEDVADKENHRWWLWVFVTPDTTVFVRGPSRSAQVAAGQLGIDRTQTALEAGRRLVISSGFYKACQSLARIDGVDALWCSAHIRRYFLRAGAAHPGQLGQWCAAWTGRIAVLYRAHHALAAAIPGSDAHEQALQRCQRAFTDLDAARILQTEPASRGLLHPATAKVIATLMRPGRRYRAHRSGPGTLPALDTPRTRPPHRSRRRPAGSGPVTP